MRAWAKNLRRRSHEAQTLLGTPPEQRNRSIPSGTRAAEASGCLRFPPLWETSGQSLVTVRLRPSWGRLRSSEIAAYRRGFAEAKPPAGLGFPPYGRRLVWCGVWCGGVVVWWCGGVWCDGVGVGVGGGVPCVVVWWCVVWWWCRHVPTTSMALPAQAVYNENHCNIVLPHAVYKENKCNYVEVEDNS